MSEHVIWSIVVMVTIVVIAVIAIGLIKELSKWIKR